MNMYKHVCLINLLTSVEHLLGARHWIKYMSTQCYTLYLMVLCVIFQIRKLRQPLRD
jgi:hypothetical protein